MLPGERRVELECFGRTGPLDVEVASAASQLYAIGLLEASVPKHRLRNAAFCSMREWLPTLGSSHRSNEPLPAHTQSCVDEPSHLYSASFAPDVPSRMCPLVFEP